MPTLVIIDYNYKIRQRPYLFVARMTYDLFVSPNFVTGKIRQPAPASLKWRLFVSGWLAHKTEWRRLEIANSVSGQKVKGYTNYKCGNVMKRRPCLQETPSLSGGNLASTTICLIQTPLLIRH